MEQRKGKENERENAFWLLAFGFWLLAFGFWQKKVNFQL